jgi:hypothetical protein
MTKMVAARKAKRIEMNTPDGAVTPTEHELAAKLAEETERGNYWFDQSYACEEEIKRLRALLGRVVGTPLSGRTIDGGTFISGELLRDIEEGLGTTVSGTGSKK